MFEFIFIDPSPNMEMLSTNLRNNMGRTVKNIYTKSFTNLRPKNIWVFIENKHFRLNNTRSNQEAEYMICKLKKPFFTKFCLRKIKDKLSEINPMLAHGTFQDYILLTGQLKTGADIPITVSNFTFDEVVSQYPSSTIITSKVPASGGRYAITHWRTDYDIVEAMGDDYFFFFDGKYRHELYRENNCIVTVSEQKTSLDWLKQVNPTLLRFNFERISSINFHQNQNPWLQKYSSKIYLLNDYSWQGSSVQMPDNWTKTFKKLVCLEKK